MKNGKHRKYTKREVIKLVTDALKKHTPDQYPADVFVVRNEVCKKKDRWYVPVDASKNIPRVWEYVNILAQAEGEFDYTDLKLILVPPGLPEGVI
jgi:phenylpyruvate tautomerase PptA (4-oxalocrotonate tautomerase family)